MHRRSKAKHLMLTKTKRAVIILFLFLMTLALVPISSQEVYALTAEQQALQQQLDEVQRKINQTNNELEAKKQAVRTLENEVAILEAQIYQAELQIQFTQSEISLAISEINELNTQIEQIKLEMKNQKDTLNDYLRIIYEESRISIIEQIVSSDNFSDFIDRSEYLQTIQLKIRDTLKKIQELKEKTEKTREEVTKKKEGLEALKYQQTLQAQSIASDKSYKDILLSQAIGAQNTVESVLDSLFSQRSALSQRYNETTLGGTTSYPYGNVPLETCYSYPPDAYGYIIGQCTSYVAWWRQTHGNPVPRNLGNAGSWAANAAAQGYSVDNIPTPGSVMVYPYQQGMPYGHVAIVEAVNPDGSVKISDYNWIAPCTFSIRDNVYPSNWGASFIH